MSQSQADDATLENQPPQSQQEVSTPGQDDSVILCREILLVKKSGFFGLRKFWKPKHCILFSTGVAYSSTHVAPVGVQVIQFIDVAHMEVELFVDKKRTGQTVTVRGLRLTTRLHRQTFELRALSRDGILLEVLMKKLSELPQAGRVERVLSRQGPPIAEEEASDYWLLD